MTQADKEDDVPRVAPLPSPAAAEPLPYASPDSHRQGHRRWAVASLTMATVAWVVGRGGMLLFNFLTRDIRNRPTDLDYILLQVASAIALLTAPPLGIAFGVIGLRRRMEHRGWALTGAALAAAAWVFPFALRFFRSLW